MSFVPRTCSARIGIDTLLPGVLIRDVTMRITWATASRSGGMHDSDRVNLPICPPSATRKSSSCSVPHLVEHRNGSCGTLWYRKRYATRCDNEVRRAWTSYTCSPPVSPLPTVIQPSHLQRGHQGYRGSRPRP